MVVGPDWVDHGADSWAWPDSGAHPDILAAIVAIRAGLWALPRKRLAVSLPSLDALRHGPGTRANLEVVDETLDGFSLVTPARAGRPGPDPVRGRRTGAAPAATRAERPAPGRVLRQRGRARTAATGQ